MKPTDFSRYLTYFFTKYMPGEMGASTNTISSYKDTFILLLTFVKDKKNIKADKLSLDVVTKELVVEFLDWIETERKCCAATRNVRLAAIHSFYQYLQYQSPENLLEWQKILSIPVKRTEAKSVRYMSLEGIKLLFETPDQSTITGRRDLALLSLMYDSGARVQEMIDLKPSMIRLDKPYTIKLIGKGNKARIVPIMDAPVVLLKKYMSEKGLLEPSANMYPLFSNYRKEKFTRAGVNYILDKYAKQARVKNPTLIPEPLSCHSLRHSKAMHLLQAGVNLIYIRDILGHSSIQVTEIYAKADSKQKREAIERAYTNVIPKEAPLWQTNGDLLEWLKSFVK